MFSRITFALALSTLFVAGSYAQSEADRDLPVVVPLHKMRAGQWVEKVWGDPEKPGRFSQSAFTMMRAILSCRTCTRWTNTSSSFRAPGGLAWEAVSNVRP
jgi:hypothetical protein